MTLFQEIREAARAVSERARSVDIDTGALRALAAQLAGERPGPPTMDPAHHHLGDAASTTAFVLTLNAVNFGSGWFPFLRKKVALSGYLTVATTLRERFETRGAFAAEELAGLSAADCAELFDQRGVDGVADLMEHFARALRDLGELLLRRWDGRFEGLVEDAGGSAGKLVDLLTEMELYRDVAAYEELRVPFYKRAQITASDLAQAFGGRGLGAFRDQDELTLFADNLVPHVLRMAGVLVYEPGLLERIDREESIASGSPEEVEIRACALHAVERLSTECGEHGFAIAPHALDHVLWARGQSPEIKAVPRHRTRCTYY